MNARDFRDYGISAFNGGARSFSRSIQKYPELKRSLHQKDLKSLLLFNMQTYKLGCGIITPNEYKQKITSIDKANGKD